MRRTERAVTLLPQPLSPTMPSVLPWVEIEVGAVNRVDEALVLKEVCLQVAYRKDGLLSLCVPIIHGLTPKSFGCIQTGVAPR